MTFEELTLEKLDERQRRTEAQVAELSKDMGKLQESVDKMDDNLDNLARTQEVSNSRAEIVSQTLLQQNTQLVSYVAEMKASNQEHRQTLEASQVEASHKRQELNQQNIWKLVFIFTSAGGIGALLVQGFLTFLKH